MQEDLFYKIISDRLQKFIDEKKYTQNDIIYNIKKEYGIEITQSALSKILNYQKNYNIKLINIVYICKYLKIDFEKLFDIKNDVINDFVSIGGSDTDFHQNDILITDPSNVAFKGYMKEFVCYFNSTISDEVELIKAKLKFISKDGQCNAIFTIYTKAYVNGDINEIEKVYSGQMLISLSQSVCYCILKRIETGEFCMMNFRHRFFSDSDLYCRLAVALTTSAGDDRRPTIHRIAICQNEYDNDEKKMSIIKSQLLLNESDIYISESRLEEITDMLNEKILNAINDCKKNSYYKINENIIHDAEALTEEEKYEAIQILRNNSAATKYNKIGAKADTAFFKMLSHDVKK